jgi:putative peptidoglycan lipid II flippase
MSLLIGAFGVILALSLIWVAVGQLANRTVAGPSPSGPVQIAVASAKDFDPVIDGGSSHENASQIGRILDSSGRSAWTTERYRGDPRLGGLKPGVGVVLDLGRPVPVRQVMVSLGGDGTSIELRVPKEQADEPPLRSETQWRSVAGSEAASGKTNLTPAEPVTTRFLLLYLTSLPPVAGGYFQGEISDVEVRG